MALVHVDPPEETIHRKLFEQGINGDSGKFVCQGNGFATMTLFTDWCRGIFFPELQRRREQYHY
jgi:hypothetical protein